VKLQILLTLLQNIIHISTIKASLNIHQEMQEW